MSMDPGQLPDLEAGRSPRRHLRAPGDARLRHGPSRGAPAALRVRRRPRGPPRARARRQRHGRRQRRAPDPREAPRLPRPLPAPRAPLRDHLHERRHRDRPAGAALSARRVPHQRGPLAPTTRKRRPGTSSPSAARRRAARSRRTAAGSTRSSTGPRTSRALGPRRPKNVRTSGLPFDEQLPGRVLEASQRARREGPARGRGGVVHGGAPPAARRSRDRSADPDRQPERDPARADRAARGAGRARRCPRRTASTAESRGRPAARSKVGVARLAEDARDGQGSPRPALRQPDHGQRGEARHGLRPDDQARGSSTGAGSRSCGSSHDATSTSFATSSRATRCPPTCARASSSCAERARASGIRTARSTSTSSPGSRSTTRATATRGSSPRSPSKRPASTALRTSSSPSLPFAWPSASRTPRSAARSSSRTPAPRRPKCAIKLARKHAHARGVETPRIVSLDGGFHGRTLGALAATPRLADEGRFGPLPDGFDAVPRDDADALSSSGERGHRRRHDRADPGRGRNLPDCRRGAHGGARSVR